MAQRTRNFLFTGPFSNGQRPDENAFNDVWESFLNYQDDPVSLDGDNNFVFDNSIRIQNTVGDDPGTIRFNGNEFQFRESTGWETLGSNAAGGAFQVVGAGPHVAFNAGNVGINTGGVASDYQLRVNLGNNAGPANQVRFGSAVIHNRTSSVNVAYFSHANFANDTGFALSHSVTGDVRINAPATRSIQFSINNANPVGLALTRDNEIVIGGNTALDNGIGGASTTLHVNGNAFKSVGGGSWRTGSDKRIKKKIRPFKDGLEILKKINPVRFQYNGKAWTHNNDENVGIIGQELKEIVPYMISSTKAKLNPKDKTEEDLLIYDGSALIYIAVNAIKELSQKVNELELKLKNHE